MSEQPTHSNSGRTRQNSITDSPWFWVYIFSTSALIALALAGPKYFPRQTQLERQFLARQEGGQTIKGADGQSIAPPTGRNLIVTLGPLFVICGLLLMVAWSRLWWGRVFSNAASKPTAESIADDANIESNPHPKVQTNATSTNQLTPDNEADKTSENPAD